MSEYPPGETGVELPPLGETGVEPGVELPPQAARINNILPKIRMQKRVAKTCLMPLFRMAYAPLLLCFKQDDV
jgi:hypothetical protein